MSYLVLARKWRPQTFDDLTGQGAVVQTLKNALASDRIAHAYLFSGVRGVGKTTSARILAKALNCEQGTGPNPCGACSTCREIAEGSSIDVIEIDGASNTGVDDVRELRDNVKYAPSRSRFKVFIIDEVHMLSTAAFNALLKTLEEPPSHVIFVFATTESHKIPATILSRCQHFVFKRISFKDVVERLRQIVDHEGVEVDDAGLLLLARASGGSLRDSLSLLDQAISFCGNRVGTADLRVLLGLTGREAVRGVMESLASKDGSATLKLVQNLTDAGQDLKRFAGELVEEVRDMIVLKSAREPADILDLTEQELAELRGLAEGFSPEELVSLFRLFMKTEAEIRYSAFPRYTLEIALLQAVRLPELTTLGELIQGLSKEEPAPISTSPRRTAQAAQAAAAQLRSSTAPTVGVDRMKPPPHQREERSVDTGKPTQSMDEGWSQVVADVKKRKPQVGSLLEQGVFMGVSGGVFTLAYRPEMADFASERLCRDDVRPMIEDLVGKMAGEAARLACSLLSEEHPKKHSLAEQAVERERKKKDRLREEAISDPLVKSALDIFGGEIVDVRPVDTIVE